MAWALKNELGEFGHFFLILKGSQMEAVGREAHPRIARQLFQIDPEGQRRSGFSDGKLHIFTLLLGGSDAVAAGEGCAHVPSPAPRGRLSRRESDIGKSATALPEGVAEIWISPNISDRMECHLTHPMPSPAEAESFAACVAIVAAFERAGVRCPDRYVTRRFDRLGC